MEPEVEMGNFVRDYGTGNEIPNPPQFINFNTPDAIPSSASRPSTRPASFIRSSTRELPSREPIEPADEEPPVNTAGVGAGGSRHSLALDPASVQSHDSRSRNGVSSVNGQVQPYMNGGSSSSRPNPSPEPNGNRAVHRKPTMSAKPPTPSSRIPQDPMAEPIDPNAETYIKVGANAYKVDLSRDPQQQSSAPSTHRSAPASPVKSATPAKQDGTVDPLQKQLLELQNAVSTTGSIRRNTLHRLSTAEQTQSTSPPPSTSPAVPPNPTSNTLKSLSPPGPTPVQSNRSPSPNRDYRNSADLVVGAHPSAPASSRPTSPHPPTAAFMRPPSQNGQPPGTEVINEVLADYQQSLPGERKSISRNNSVNRPVSAQAQGHTPHQSVASITTPGQTNANQGHELQRPNSRLGHVGIGAHGGSRSNSPLPQSRGPSPAPMAQAAPGAPPAARHSLISPAHNITRAPSPNSVGIALDPNGRVLHDEMAQGFQGPGQAHRQSQPPPQQRPPQQAQQPAYHPAPAPSPQQSAQRRPSYVPAAAPVSAPTIAPPAAPRMYAVTPPPPPPANAYQPPAPPAQPVYAPPPPANHPTYTPPSQLLYQQQQQQAAPPHQATYQQPQQPQQPGSTYGASGPQRNSSAMGMNSYYEPPLQQYPQRQQALGQPSYQQPTQQWNQGPSPGAVRRTPSPQPPPQPTTEDGSTILFYGMRFSILPCVYFD